LKKNFLPVIGRGSRVVDSIIALARCLEQHVFVFTNLAFFLSLFFYVHM
jgi:hypothetical protein